jgi:hypothetical protein
MTGRSPCWELLTELLIRRRQCPLPLPRSLRTWRRPYAHCERVTSIHSRSFSLASRLLPREVREAVHALLYAFCRTVDDLVDEPAGNTEAALDFLLPEA